MSDFAQQALEELQKVTGSDNRDNPWLGVVAAVYLWHTRIKQLTKACEALLDAHDQSFVGREEMRDLYYSAHPRRAAAYKQARKAIESVRGIEASYPDPGCEAAARERDDLRARLAALCVEMETDDRAGKLAHWIGAIRALLAETEGK